MWWKGRKEIGEKKQQKQIKNNNNVNRLLRELRYCIYWDNDNYMQMLV